MSEFYFFFFFQAEDGIRDVAVTGVQTCALPIYRRVFAGYSNLWDAPGCRGGRRNRRGGGQRPGTAFAVVGLSRRRRLPGRSEERRVGKEGRSRGAPDH